MKILERTLVFSLLLIIGSLLGPIAYKHYTYKPLETITPDQDWTITLYSPNGDEYETWHYTGQKPRHVYWNAGSYLTTKENGPTLKTTTGEPGAPIGWYLDIKPTTDNHTQITKTP